MSLLGQFAAPVGAMMAQSKAMEVVGMNIANLNTGGYKRSETNFYTMVAQTYDQNRDIGAVRGLNRQLIDQQGQILGSSSNLDVAINGQGFFVLNAQLDGSGETLYGRDGMFSMDLGNEITTTINGAAVTTREGYLVDKNGYFVQGWPVNADQQTFPTDEASLGPLRIDPEAFSDTGEGTTTASVGLNIPSDAAVGYSESTFVRAYDSTGELDTFQLRWTNIVLGSNTATATPTWQLPGAAAAGYNEAISVTTQNNRGYEKDYTLSWTKSATANTYELQVLEGNDPLSIDTDATPRTLDVTFDPVTGAVVGPTSVSIQGTGNFDDAFTLDLSQMTENAVGATVVQTSFTQDGIQADAQKNKYSLEILENGTALEIDGDATPTNLEVTFGTDAQLISPTTVTITNAAGDTSFTLDLSDITYYNSDKIVENYYEFNGRSNAKLQGISFNPNGEIIGEFDDATTRPIYKLPLATFTNPNSLDPLNGNVYRVSGFTSEAVIRTAGGQGAGTFQPNAREISNVDLADEFTTMIMTQKAYNTSSTVFKTVDEMSQVARDLKR